MRILSSIVRNQTEHRSFLRRIIGNFGKLLGGRSAAAVLEVITIVVLTRSLSTADFGNVVLIQTYGQIVRALFNFRLGETVVRFGVPKLEDNNELSFRRLLRAALYIEVTASGCSFIVAILALPLAASFFDWEPGLVPAAMIYSLVLLTSARGTPKGILRALNRFDVLGLQTVVNPVLRLVGVLVAAMLDAKVLLFVCALTLGTFAGNVYLIARGWIEFRRQVGGRILRGPSLEPLREDFPDLRSFIPVVYVQMNLDKLPQQVSTLMAGAMLGPSAAAMMRVAREATKILSKPGGLLQQALFPDLVRLWGRSSGSFNSILLRMILITGLFGSVIITASIFGGRYLLTGVVGPDYAVAAPLMSLFLLSATLELVVFMLRAGGYAMGLAGMILWLHVVAAALYLIAFLVLTPHMGLIGPGVAACFSATVALVGISIIVSKGVRKAQLNPDQPSADTQ